MRIREIKEKDNKQVESVIRTCLLEFGGNREGLAWADPDLGEFSRVYSKEKTKYWVVEDSDGNIVGGCGIGVINGAPEDTCELQKMYCLQEVRGTGISNKLMTIALDFAKEYYKYCYIETLSNMLAANRFYLKYGFEKLQEPLIKSDHYACDMWYLKSL